MQNTRFNQIKNLLSNFNRQATDQICHEVEFSGHMKVFIMKQGGLDPIEERKREARKFSFFEVCTLPYHHLLERAFRIFRLLLCQRRRVLRRRRFFLERGG